MSAKHAMEISCRNLSWKPKERSTPILNRVSLEFAPGSICGIIGPNGSGKSSLLRHIMGFLPVQEGEVLWGGRKVGKYSRKELARLTAYVPQETRLDTDFTAFDVVMTGRNPYQDRWGRPGEDDIKKTRKAMAFAGCSHLSRQPFRQLSGGEAQKVIIARAIAQETPWILLDEPVSGLDVKSETEVLTRLKKLNETEGTSILIVLHDLNAAAAYCDSIVMMKEGRVMFCGTACDAMNPARLDELYVITFGELSAGDGRKFFYPIA